MGEKSNPNGRNTTETLKSKMKHRMPMFHLLKVLIINALCCENETWNKKRLKVNIMYAYVRARRERVLTWGRRVLTWGRRVPASAFACQGSMPWQANTIHFLIAKLGHRTPTWQCRRGDASPPSEDAPLSEDASSAHLYIYTREINTFMFFNTKRKKIVPIICSFKAENVLLPCYSFPAKKSLKKVSFFKSLVYNVLRV